MRILLLDNYDSFTYNLVHHIEEIQGNEVEVLRNDEISVEAVAAYDCIIISPGPGVPKESGITLEVIKKYYSTKPILGVCLGLQAIVESFGGEIYNLDDIYHGITSDIVVVDKNDPLFKGVPSPFPAGRYHSWAAVKEGFPEVLKITAVDKEGSVMALRHRTADLWAVQFHPESIMTPDGKQMLANFLEQVESRG